MKQLLVRTAILAGLMSAGAAMAQPTSIPAAPDPSLGGEASTQTLSGVPNPPQRPSGMEPASREAVKAEARAQNRNNANSLVPKGEASTTMNSQPNATPAPTGERSRYEVSQEARKVKPRFGQKGERPDVPTNPTDRTGTPQ